jgi:PAS domain-containing protein
MNKVSQFSNFIKRQLPLFGTVEIETLLNSLPQAAIIVNNLNDHIQLVNTKAMELTAYTRSELTLVDFQNLFQKIKIENPEISDQVEEVRNPSVGDQKL